EDTSEETGDAPLIDVSEASVKRMIARAKERGYITYDELNANLPQEQMSSEQIEDIMAMLNEMGINVIEGDDSEDAEAEEPAVQEIGADAEGEEGAPEAPVVEKKTTTLDRTDDPVRMYLREMGAVELL